MAVVAFYAAWHHLRLYCRRRSSTVDLTFAITALGIALLLLWLTLDHTLKPEDSRWINTTEYTLAGIILMMTYALAAGMAERRKTQHELQENEAKFRALADTSPLAIYMSTGIELRAEYINPAFIKLFGYTMEDVPSAEEWYPLAYPDPVYREQLVSEWKKGVAHAIETKSQVEPKEAVVTCKDGSKKYISWSFIATGKQNWACGLDLTERKRAEAEAAKLQAQLMHTQKMEAIGTLARGIAHDFNNILAAILGYAEMVRDDLPDGSPSQPRIAHILEAGDRAKKLVRQILAFGHKAETNRMPVRMDGLITEVSNFIRAIIPTTIAIKLHITPECGSILADPTQIHQVLMNLCTNAAQAMEDHGGVLSIGLSVKDLKIHDLNGKSGLKPGAYLLIAVSDTGSGIEKEHLDRIFDPYFTTKEFGRGSGMGLSIVHGIVQRHGGMITAESLPGQGTTFKVYLPKIQESAEQPAVISAPPPSTGRERILVVDDDAAIATLTEKRLAMLGYEATATTSSQEALELFRAAPDNFALVITDQTMPNMTGEQLSKELLNIRSDLPIILCTGYSTAADKEKAISIGIRAFLMKPIDNREFAIAVRDVLDSR